MEGNLFEQAWRGFHGDSWKEETDLSNFIVRNFTEYKGDDSFLAGPTEKTKAVWSKCAIWPLWAETALDAAKIIASINKVLLKNLFIEWIVNDDKLSASYE